MRLQKLCFPLISPLELLVLYMLFQELFFHLCLFKYNSEFIKHFMAFFRVPKFQLFFYVFLLKIIISFEPIVMTLLSCLICCIIYQP